MRDFKKSDIGKTIDGWTMIEWHESAKGAVLRRDIKAEVSSAEVVASDFIILDGALASPICDLWVRLVIDSQDFWFEGYDTDQMRREIQLIHLSDGHVRAFMAYEPGNNDNTGHMGLGSSAHFADDQEARLKFLTKFNMNDSDFNELNPPWEYPHG
jgi:hypothetical protein